MNVRKPLTVLALVPALVLAACGGGDDATPESTTSTTSAKTTASSTSTSATPTSEPEPAPEPEPSAAAPVEPTVVECLPGTPGPARWSDGSLAYSDYCFHANGGPAYLEQEGQSGLQPPAPAEPQQPSPWVQGQIDWANCLEAGNSEEQCRNMLN